MSKRHPPNCIESAYAIVYFINLFFLFMGLWFWIKALRLRWNTLTDSMKFVEVFILISVSACVLQFARIYHYIHEFDRRCRDPNHFIAKLKGCHRRIERISRWSAGICVIIGIEMSDAMEWAEHLPRGVPEETLTYQFLCYFSISLLFTFLFLFLWDCNLLFWYRNNTLSQETMESLNEYAPILKLFQRVAGIIFSIFFLLMLYNPEYSGWHILFGGFVSIFWLLWIIDYRFLWISNHQFIHGFRKGIRKFFVETFSTFCVIVEFFRR